MVSISKRSFSPGNLVSASRSTTLVQPRNKKKSSILDLNLRQGPTCSDAPWRRMQFRLRGVNRKLDPRQSEPRRCDIHRAESVGMNAGAGTRVIEAQCGVVRCCVWEKTSRDETTNDDLDDCARFHDLPLARGELPSRDGVSGWHMAADWCDAGGYEPKLEALRRRNPVRSGLRRGLRPG